MKTKSFISALLLLFAVSLSAQTGTVQTEQYKQEIREKLQLDNSLPDYSTSRIDSKLMGPRLAKILDYINKNYQQPTNLGALSVIQSKQVEGLNYGRIKTLKLNKVTKNGNEITIVFTTTLEQNILNLKKSQIVFRFFDGVSDDAATNDFFVNVSRYIKD